MNTIAETLGPLVLIGCLGFLLARVRFLGLPFIADLNKLAFFVALPALLFRSAAGCPFPEPRAWALFGVLMAVTLLTIGCGFALAALSGTARNARATLVQSTYRGNLAYVGIPVLAFVGPGEPAGAQSFLSSTVFAMTLLMAFYNVFASVLFRNGKAEGNALSAVTRSIATNPLVLAGLFGLAFGSAGLVLPPLADRTLKTLGDASVPIALLCIGGTLANRPFSGRPADLAIAVGLKNFFLPAGAFLLCRACGFGVDDTRIAVVLAAAPTALTSYVMAAKLGGDEALAGSTVTATTLAGIPGVALALAVTS